MKPISWWAVSHTGCKLSTSSKLAHSLACANAATSSVRDFARRHIGPNSVQTSAMLEYLELQVISLLFCRVCHIFFRGCMI